MNVDSCDDCKKQGTNKCDNKPHHWCSDHVKKKVCPLPRIGSKDWKWTWSFAMGWWHSPKADYLIEQHEGGYTVFTMCSENPPTFRIVYGEKLLALRDARVVAEARARQDWKDKNEVSKLSPTRG